MALGASTVGRVARVVASIALVAACTTEPTQGPGIEQDAAAGSDAAGLDDMGFAGAGGDVGGIGGIGADTAFEEPDPDASQDPGQPPPDAAPDTAPTPDAKPLPDAAPDADEPDAQETSDSGPPASECGGGDTCPEGFYCEAGTCVLGEEWEDEGVSGLVILPEGQSPAGMLVLGGSSLAAVTDSGAFWLSEPLPEGVTLVYAFHPEPTVIPMKVVALLDGEEPSTPLVLDMASTAAALVWQSPVLPGRDIASAQAFEQVAHSDPAVQAVADLLATTAESDPLDDPELPGLYAAAVASVYDALPDDEGGPPAGPLPCPGCYVVPSSSSEPKSLLHDIDLEVTKGLFGSGDFTGQVVPEEVSDTQIAWIVEVAELQPIQPSLRYFGWWESAGQTCAEEYEVAEPVSLEGNRTVFERSGDVHVRLVDQSAKYGDKFDLVAQAVGLVFPDSSAEDDSVKPVDLADIGGDKAWVVRAWSGAWSLGIDPEEGAELAEASSWPHAAARKANLVLAALDAVSLLVDVSGALDGAVAAVVSTVGSELAELEATGQEPDAAKLYDLISDAAIAYGTDALYTTLTNSLGEEGAEAAGSVMGKFAKVLKMGAQTIDLVAKAGKLISVWARVVGMTTGPTPVESAVVIIGDPFRETWCTDCDFQTWQQYKADYNPDTGEGEPGLDLCFTCGALGEPCCDGDLVLSDNGESVYTLQGTNEGPGNTAVCAGESGDWEEGAACINGKCELTECTPNSVGQALFWHDNPNPQFGWAQVTCDSEGKLAFCSESTTASHWLKGAGGLNLCLDGQVHTCTDDLSCAGAAVCRPFPALFEHLFSDLTVDGEPAPFTADDIFVEKKTCVACEPDSPCITLASGAEVGKCVLIEGTDTAMPSYACKHCETDGDCQAMFDAYPEGSSIDALTCNSGNWCRCTTNDDCPAYTKYNGDPGTPTCDTFSGTCYCPQIKSASGIEVKCHEK